MGLFKNCCCGCSVIQVNARKPHAGFYALASGAHLGSWRVDNPDALEFPAGVPEIVSDSLASWPYVQDGIFDPCNGKRWLQYDLTGNSAGVEFPGGVETRFDVTFRGRIIIDKRTGLLLSSKWYVTKNTDPEQTYFEMELNETTGNYTITNNSATCFPPYFRSIDHALAQTGGFATLDVAEDEITQTFYIPDINYASGAVGPSLGSVTQTVQIKLSQLYDEAQLFNDLQDLLDSVDLADMQDGDPTGTFVPMRWQTEYTIGWQSFPIEQGMVEDTYVYNAGDGSCTYNASFHPYFSPYAGKLYGTDDQITGFLFSQQGRHWKIPTINAGTVPTPPGTANAPYPTIAARSTEWGQLSKARVAPAGEEVGLYQAEQQPCDCAAEFSDTEPYVFTYNCNANNWLATGVTDCDNNFYDPASPVITCTDGRQTDVCLYPGDILFAYGIGALFPTCVSTHPAGQLRWCAVLNVNPCL